MMFERKKYLDELIAGRGNGLVKIITGVRRCGKSFLLFDIWHNWLLEHGVTDNHIIEIQLHYCPVKFSRTLFKCLKFNEIQRS